MHACAHEALGAPEHPASAFALLATHRIIAQPLVHRMTKAAGLRNLLVHRYTDLDLSKLIEAIRAGLQDLDDFAAALRDHANEQGPCMVPLWFAVGPGAESRFVIGLLLGAGRVGYGQQRCPQYRECGQIDCPHLRCCSIDSFYGSKAHQPASA